jgi:hypothetical protein
LRVDGLWYRGEARAHLIRVVAAVVGVAEAELPIGVVSEGADGPVLHEHHRVRISSGNSLCSGFMVGSVFECLLFSG